MADEKTVVKGQEEKVNFFTKVINFFKKLPSAIARPFKNMWHELRKVTWPSRPDVIKYSIIVLVFLVFLGVVIALLDAGSFELVKAITPPDKAQQEYDKLMDELLAGYPEGTYINEAGYIVLPEDYTFDIKGNAVNKAEYLATLPEGSSIGEFYEIILPEGYTFSAAGEAVETEAYLATLPEGTEIGDNYEIKLPEGYAFDENGTLIQLPTEIVDGTEEKVEEASTQE